MRTALMLNGTTRRMGGSVPASLFYFRRLLFAEFIPQNIIMRYMTSGMPLSYVVATLMVHVFHVCSCTMVPKFAGLIYAVGGVGSALTFLLVAPANKLLAAIITMQVLGWKIALAHADGHTRL